MKSFARLFRVTIWLCLISLSAVNVASAEAAAPRSIEGIGSDLDDLESLIDHLEKNIGTWDEKQRASAYARLLALAEKIGIALHQQRQLLNTAIQSQPGNDPNGGLSKTVQADQKARMALLNRLDGRLKGLRERIAALDPSKKAAGGGPAPGGAGAGAGRGTTVTPAGGGK